jgi:hypothetical protein
MIVVTTTKPWWESKTIWFNVLSIIVLAVLVYDDVVRKNGGLASGAIALGNLYLRLNTVHELTLNKDEGENKNG